MVCQNCGAALAANERFCRSCGAVAQPAAAPNAPAPEDAWALPVDGGAPQQERSRSGGGRPGWLIPALVAGAVAVLAAGAGYVFLGSSSSDPKPLSEQAVPVITPVRVDLSKLSGDLEPPQSKAALAKAKADAVTLGAAAVAAAATVRGLDLPAADETARRLLAASLDATGEYADRIGDAARDPRRASIDEAGSAADRATSSFSALGSAVPELKLPARSLFAVVVVAGGAGGDSKARAYVKKIDSALTRSARTRGSLGDLIEGVSSKKIPADEAASEAASIVAQRNQLKAVVRAVAAPSAFKRPSALLLASLDAAIADDVAIQDWVLAGASGDPTGADAAWARHLAATAKATAAKAAFVKAYNAARKQQLQLRPLPVGDKY